MLKVLIIHAPFYSVKHQFLTRLLKEDPPRAQGRIEGTQALMCDLHLLQFPNEVQLLIIDLENFLDELNLIRNLFREADAILDFAQPNHVSRVEKLLHELQTAPVLKFELQEFDHLLDDDRAWDEKETERSHLLSEVMTEARHFLKDSIKIDIFSGSQRVDEFSTSFDRLPGLDQLRVTSSIFGADPLSQNLKEILLNRRSR